MNIVKKAHISIDDCMPAFRELTENQDKYENIFEVDFLKGLKYLHEKYDAVFSLYFWECKSGFSILQITDKYKEQFQACKDWLTFGFHGSAKFDYLNSDCGGRNTKEFIEAYNNTMEGIDRCFSSEAKTDLIRLHRYVASEEEIQFLKEQNIQGLLTAHDDRISYDLTRHEISILNQTGKRERNSMMYLKTDYCLDAMQEELLLELDKRIGQEFIVLFIHEKVFCDKLALLERVLNWCIENDYVFINKLM